MGKIKLTDKQKEIINLLRVGCVLLKKTSPPYNGSFGYEGAPIIRSETFSKLADLRLIEYYSHTASLKKVFLTNLGRTIEL